MKRPDKRERAANREITLMAPAKINLTLDVTGRRDDGYHLLESIMQAIDFADEVTVRLDDRPGAIRLRLSDDTLPVDARNTAYRAAAVFLVALEQRAGEPVGVDIAIRKHIPMQAGLAGGSADAAAVLVALNRLTDARLTDEELCALGETVGADVPFCILGGAAMATGTGTILSPLPPLPPCSIVVAKPEGGVSTPEAYRRIDEADILHRPHASVVEDALCAGDLAAVGRALCNVFEQALDMPAVREIQEEMRRFETLGCQMTGSGSAVFGLFEKKGDARRCAEALRRICPVVQVCQPCTCGPYPASRRKDLENFV